MSTSTAPATSSTAQAPARETQSPAQPPGGAVATAAPQEVRKMKLKLDGRDVELPESEVIAGYQRESVANQRFQEAAQMRKEAEQILQFAKQNPKEFFQKTGLNARQWAEEYLIQELQTEAMSPEQRKARENEEKIRMYENEKKQAADSQRQEQMKRLEAEHAKNYDLMFTQALHESGLPKTQFTVKRMAELQLINIKNKYELSASQLAKLVREDYANEQKSLLSAFDGDQLMEFLGADTVKKLSKAQIAKLKNKIQSPGSVGQTKTTKASGDQGGLTWAEYRKRNRKI